MGLFIWSFLESIRAQKVSENPNCFTLFANFTKKWSHVLFETLFKVVRNVHANIWGNDDEPIELRNVYILFQN